jgi:histidinol-phosphate aminotransferase
VTGRLRPPRPDLAEVAPYDAREPAVEVNLAANENPRNLPRELIATIADRLPDFAFNRYPDPMATKVREMIADANGLDADNVLLGNGGDELIFDLLLAWGGPGRTLLTMPPTFAMYAIDAHVTGTNLEEIPRGTEDFSVDEAAVLERVGRGDVDCVFISHPNNPTGNLQPETFLIDLLDATDALVLIDEAYFEFSRHTMRPHMERHPNLVILRTFSKAFSMAGMRVGYLLGHADVISELTKVRQPYSVDRFSQWVAGLVFRERVVFEAQIHEITVQRDSVQAELARIEGVTVFPSEANFVLFRVDRAAAVWRDLLHTYDVLVRDLSRTPGLEDCLRVSIGSEAENRRFLAAMREILEGRRQREAAGIANGFAAGDVVEHEAEHRD